MTTPISTEAEAAGLIAADLVSIAAVLPDGAKPLLVQSDIEHGTTDHTIANPERACLASKRKWQTAPASTLFAWATSRLVRRLALAALDRTGVAP